MDLIERRGSGVTQRIFRFSAYLCALCGFFFAPSLSATVIVQKNGDVISGRILEEQADKYIFQSPYGKLQIAKTNVTKLILDEKTIELKTVQVGDKTVQARLVNQDKNTSVYLTEDGRTIRKEEGGEKETPQPEAEKKGPPADKILLGISGYYGFATFAQVTGDQGAAGNPAPTANTFRPGALGGHISGHYSLGDYLGVGLVGSFNRWSGSGSVPPPSLTTFDVQTTNTSILVAPSLVVSVLGHLGSNRSRHDLRVELQPGVAFNSASMELTFKTFPAGPLPGPTTSSGKNVSFALQAQIYYLYSISESLRLRAGGGYYRAFHGNIYETGLSGVPGAFPTDFAASQGKADQAPQIFSVVLGVEFGF